MRDSSSGSISDSDVVLSDWPVYRNNVVDFLKYSRKRHHVACAWEVDLTHTQQRIRELQRRSMTGISFNAYLIYLLARAVSVHPEVQAVRVPFRRKVATFDGADVGTAVEHRLPDGRSIALPYTVRHADRKSLADICIEMRAASKAHLMDTDDGIRWRARLAHYPGFIRRLVWKWIDLDPARRRRVRGTFGLTNLNFLTDRGHEVFGYPMSLLTTSLCVGASYDRLVPCDEDPRGFRKSLRLCLTLLSDHDLVDGAPMGRFARTFSMALERGDGLDDDLVETLLAHRNASNRRSST